MSAIGAFDYADPDVAGIPMWLPALWANGGIFIRRLLAPVVLEDYRSRSSTSPPSAPDVGGSVGAERDRRVVVVEAEARCRQAACRPSSRCGSRSR